MKLGQHLVAVAFLLGMATAVHADDLVAVEDSRSGIVQELSTAIERAQDRFAGKVIEVEGVYSHNFVVGMRPTSFHAKVDGSRFWCKYQLPWVEVNEATGKLQCIGMTPLETGAVGYYRVLLNGGQDPYFAVRSKFSRQEEGNGLDPNLLAGLLLATGKRPILGNLLNTEQGSLLLSLVSHPDANIEVLDGGKGYSVKYMSEKDTLHAVLKSEPEVHCVQLDVIDSQSGEARLRYTIHYHESDIGWAPKFAVRALKDGSKSIATYTKLKLRDAVPNSEFLPEIPENVEVRDPWKLLPKLERLRAGEAFEDVTSQSP